VDISNSAVAAMLHYKHFIKWLLMKEKYGAMCLLQMYLDTTRSLKRLKTLANKITLTFSIFAVVRIMQAFIYKIQMLKNQLGGGR